MSGKIVKVSGPLVVATGLKDANMADVVRVGEQRLIGEILTMNGDSASIQVYEETSGLGPGAVVETTGAPMSVDLGPGIIENIYDGIQRPLEGIMRKAGSNNLPRGVEVPALDREKKWDFVATAKKGDKVVGGDVIGTVQETSVVLHKIMIPPTMRGTIESIQSGSFTVKDTVAVLVDGKGVGDVGNIVMRDRQHLAEDGIMIVVLTLEKHSGNLLAGPDIVSRGFVYVRESEDLMDEARIVVEDAIDVCLDKHITDWGKIKNIIKDSLGDFLWKRTKRNPMILPIIMEA